MTDFLNFLNTADHESLKKIPGVSNTLAGNIIAARPFDYVDDCLLVHGMGKNLLSRMQAYVQAQGNESENRAMIPVEEEAPPAPIWESQPAQENAKDEESFLSRLGRAFVNFLRALLRLILITALIAGIGAILYYGLPYINKTFITPVEQNTAQIDKIETDISTLQMLLADVNIRVGALEKSVETHTLSIQKLEEMQTMLESELQTNNNQALLELKHEVMITRALDMLARARLYLSQSNFGLAKVDVGSARDLLVELQTETQDEILTQVIARLDFALGNLPDFPVAASGDLEIAWQILMTSEQVILAAETPTPAPLPTFTPTLEAILTLTSTPLPPPIVISTATP